MNGSKRARYQQTIGNRFSGGGVKKAGLVPTQTKRSSTLQVAYKNRHLPLPMSVMMQPLVSTVHPSRPIGFKRMHWR